MINGAGASQGNARPSTADNLSLNLTGKSRNQINGGYNGVTNTSGQQMAQHLNHGESSKDVGVNEKFTIGSIPRSTTNKTYSSLTNQMREQTEQLVPSTSRGLSSTGQTQANVPQQNQYFQKSN